MKYNKLAIWGFILTIIIPFIIYFGLDIIREYAVSIRDLDARPFGFTQVEPSPILNFFIYTLYHSRDALISISLFLGFIISTLSLFKLKTYEEKGKFLSIISVATVLIILLYFTYYSLRLDCVFTKDFESQQARGCIIVL